MLKLNLILRYMKTIHFSKQIFVYITSLQAHGEKKQANPHKFLLKLRPVSRTAQKAAVSIPKAVI